MKQLDGRKLSRKTQEEIRIRTVKMVKKGLSPEVAAKNLGFHRSTIYSWLKAYDMKGKKALYLKKASGRPSILSSSQTNWLCKALSSDPRQLKFEFYLWTRSRVIFAIERKFNIRLGKTTVTKLLKRLGFTFQKPATRFDKQDPVIVEKWLEEDYPSIKKEAKEVGATIYFGDEAGVSLNYPIGKTIGKKGNTPIVKQTSRRGRVNMISAISSQGQCKFMTVEENVAVNDIVFISFLEKLIKDSKTPIFLILDNHPIHKSGKVKAFLEKINSKSKLNPDGNEILKIFFLPKYSPELNPDELVWNHVKNYGLSRDPVFSAKDLKLRVQSKLHQLQKMPEKVKSFFRTATTAYTLA